ncbi:uncharacterized protein LOC113275766 isoform X2 [Papaver somniferum]|uniref:uncharacterized protein LOC113275766 isoform X2 n=2 Tax=Papaver somniferum TaxID=3469 RepID=UPI000E6F89DB|nr:uncharacterized protein LOC113275766 isoform X2 [Papaver somniferum]
MQLWVRLSIYIRCVLMLLWCGQLMFSRWNPIDRRTIFLCYVLNFVSMLETLEKYERIKGILPVSSEPVVNDIEDEALQDYLQLKARAEVLQQNYRNLQGEGLETLRFEELDQLENQLEVTLKQVRSEKTQSMFGHLAELQQKEQMQREANKTLSKKMEEDNAETALRLSWKVAEQQRQQGMDEDKADMALQLSWHYNCHGKRVNSKGSSRLTKIRQKWHYNCHGKRMNSKGSSRLTKKRQKWHYNCHGKRMNSKGSSRLTKIRQKWHYNCHGKLMNSKGSSRLTKIRQKWHYNCHGKRMNSKGSSRLTKIRQK